ncbi:MAG: PASTA domain-containing protein [Clostridia bacterium]|nr:PASTA domain-containing protein [Clostridia bacterium]
MVESKVQGKILTSRTRLSVIFIVLTSVFVLLIARIAYWGLIRGEDLEREAQNQWISDTVVSAHRGSILDRSGNVLAQSAGADTVVLLPQEVEEPETVASELAEILDLDRADLLTKASTKTRTDSDGTEHDIYEVWIKRQITAEQSAAIEELNLDGVKLIADIQRYYPNRSLASQVVGYTSMDGDGQTGIERRFNSVLEGRQGRTIAETDRLNNDIPNGDEMIIEPVDGQNVVLTINEVIQSFLEESCQEALESLGADSIQGTIMDVATREILAMANAPSFDLNDPPRSDSEQLLREGTNIVTARAFEPGAIFSVFTAAAAYDSDNLRSSYVCNGAATIDGVELACPDVHGTQTFDEAVANQCVVAAGYMATDIGLQDFYSYLGDFGFGSPTGIEVTADNAGSLMEMKYATEAEVARMGGGVSLKVTQMQLIDAIAALLDAGTLKTPQLVLELEDTSGQTTETYHTEMVSTAVSAATADRIQTIITDEQALEGSFLSGYTAGVLTAAALQPQDSLENSGSQCVSMCAAFSPADDPRFLVFMTAQGPADAVNSETALEEYVQSVLRDTLLYSGVQPSEPASQPSADENGAEPSSLPSMVPVPRLVGLDLRSALEAAAEQGLEVKADGTGTVNGQYPYAGTEVERGSTVQLEMSVRSSSQDAETTLPGGQTTVPNFIGMDFDEAMETARRAGLTFLAQGTGTAVTQSPVAGAAVERGATVTVTFRIDVN